MSHDEMYTDVVNEATLSDQDVPSEADRSEETSPTEKVLDPLRLLPGGASDSDIAKCVNEFARYASGLGGAEKTILLGRASTELQRLAVRNPAGVIKSALDQAARSPSANTESTCSLFEDVEPWATSVDGGELLGAVVAAIVTYVAVDPVAAIAIALWLFHAHALDAADISPILAVWSPTKRSGKTTLVSLLTELVPRPLATSNVTMAVIYRTIEKYHPTLLIDEADTFVRDNDELIGILNSGHNRRVAKVVRLVGEDFEPTIFSTWAAKAIALIGKLPGTLEDRSISIELRRMASTESVLRFRADRVNELHCLRRRLARWAVDNFDALRSADPDVPPVLNSRAADNWRTLLAISERIGEPWASKASAAAVILSTRKDGDTSVEELLLADIRDFFARNCINRTRSHDLVVWLIALEDRPWSEIRNGRPMTTNVLAQLLRNFKVVPKMMRLGTPASAAPPARGYSLAQFEDAFLRYLPATPGPRAATPQQPLPDKAQSLVQGETEKTSVSGSGCLEPSNDGDCCDVAPWEPENPEAFVLADDTSTGVDRKDER